MHDQGTTRKPRLLDRLARVPLPVVAAMFVLGGLLAGLQMMWIASVHESGAAEPPQWLARVTVMQVNLLVPLAAIMLWARRRWVQGRLGAVAAAMLAVLPVVHVLLTVASLLWGLVLGRGDLTFPFMYVEYLTFVSFAGFFVSAVAWWLDADTPRLIGPLLVVGLVLNFAVPWGMLCCYAALAVVLMTRGLTRERRGVDRLIADGEPVT